MIVSNVTDTFCGLSRRSSCDHGFDLFSQTSCSKKLSKVAPLWSVSFRFFLGFIGIPLVAGSAVASALDQRHFAVEIGFLFGVEL